MYRVGRADAVAALERLRARHTASHHKGQLAHFDDHNDPLTMLSRGQKLPEAIREDDAVDLVLRNRATSHCIIR
jgi:hypothetical protein